MRPSRTGGTVPTANQTIPPTPVLTATSGGYLAFSYSGTLPDQWSCQACGDNDPADSLNTTVGTDTTMSAGAPPGTSVMIRGLASDNVTWQTPASNCVTTIA